MPGERKHIDRLYMPDLIPVLYQILQVAGQSLRAAGYIYDFLWSQTAERTQEALIAAGTRRVHEDDICTLPLCRKIYHEAARIALCKHSIADSVHFCVDLRILYRIRVQFHANHLPGRRSCCQSDRSNAAVSINDPFLFQSDLRTR